MKKKPVLTIAGILFLIAEAVLYGIILVQTFTDGYAPVFRYLCVVAAAVFSALLFGIRRERKDFFLLTAFLFTCIADYFLVLLDDRYGLAVSLFLLAQIFHFLRIFAKRKEGWKSSLILRLAFSFGVVLFFIILKTDTFLYYVGGVYIVNLLVNALDAFRKRKKDRRFLLLFSGLVLFILCDITVGLYGIHQDLGIPEAIAFRISDLTYVFYVPSQALIAFSGLFI